MTWSLLRDAVFAFVIVYVVLVAALTGLTS